MRPHEVQPRMATHTGKHTQPEHVAGPGRRAARGRRRSARSTHHLGRYTARQGSNNNRRNISERTAARRTPESARRTLRRTARTAPYRINRAPWHTVRPNENRNTRPARRTHGGLFSASRTGGRKRLPPLFIRHKPKAAAATALLDVLNQHRSTRNTAARTARLTAVQRTNTKHRTKILPEH